MVGEEVKADEAAAAAEGCAAAHSDPVDSAAPATAPEITARLSKEFVAWILHRKWVSFNDDPDEYYNQMINDPDRPEEYTPEYLEEERDMMRELIAHNERSRVRFIKFQEWVRSQLDQKGYVEVGESYIRQCAINRQSMPPEQWSAMMGELKLYEDEEKKPGDGAIAIEKK